MIVWLRVIPTHHTIAVQPRVRETVNPLSHTILSQYIHTFVLVVYCIVFTHLLPFTLYLSATEDHIEKYRLRRTCTSHFTEWQVYVQTLLECAVYRVQNLFRHINFQQIHCSLLLGSVFAPPLTHSPPPLSTSSADYLQPHFDFLLPFPLSYPLTSAFKTLCRCELTCTDLSTVRLRKSYLLGVCNARGLSSRLPKIPSEF